MKKLLAIVVLGLMWSGNANAFGSRDICVGISVGLTKPYYYYYHPITVHYADRGKDCFEFSDTRRSVSASDKTLYKKLKKYAGKNHIKRKMYSLEQMEIALGADYSYLGLMSSEEASKKEIEFKKAKAERASKMIKEKQKKRLIALEKTYGEKCTGTTFKKRFKKGTEIYNNCLISEKKADDKRKSDQAKKLASMSPKERHSYNCATAFNFRKGSDKFNDCVFKLYTAELDIQKLELEKQVAEAKIKAAATQQARAEAVANAQIAAAKAAKRAASLNSSIQLMQMGSSMLGSSAPKSNNSFGIENRVRTTCRNVGGFLNCY